MRLRFDPRALQEFEDSVQAYLDRSPHAASQFVDAFEAAIDFIRKHPRTPARLHGEVRRWNLRRFPHALIYLPTKDAVIILAVMHGRRRPAYWQSRVP